MNSWQNTTIMKREDYLMRMLEAFARQLGQMVAQVLDLAKEGNYEEAHMLLNQATRQLVSLSTDGLVRMPDDALLETLKLDKRTNWTERAAYLAFLLREDGRIYLLQGNEKAAVGRFITALHLQLAVFPTPDQTIVQMDDIADTLSALDEYELPGRTYAALLRHFEQAQAYAKAEDVLFDWMEAETALADLNDVNPVEMGVAFYERLLQKTDEALVAGNLPRAEVEAGLEELLANE
ncbi:MAG: hypothetical protein KC419_02390 [Anaerolineales bacterium]|nr:hypothetical protein [Anaerolineales bacterium]